MPKWIERFVSQLAQLPRSQKRLLMLVADIIGIPLVLWSSLTLRLGTINHNVAGTEWIYVAALFTSVLVFTRMGLYRAVIRYLGPRAILAVFTGVTTSVILLTVAALLWPKRAIP